MRVLVTGANGQLGQDLVNVLSDQHQIFGLGRQQMDITDISSVLDAVQSIKPNILIHAAAYTCVDQAEKDRDRAYLINTYGTRNIAVAAQQLGAKIIYISTDYVFDGQSEVPYQEYDPPNPLNVYGKSKLAGEELVKSLSDKYFIVRTSWLYGKYGKNFVYTMLKLAEERNEVSVVYDQMGSPTYTMDLIRFLRDLLETDKYGIYHASNTGACSWYEFAKAIFVEAQFDINVTPIETNSFPLPARRPPYSVLDHMGIRLNGFTDFRHWKDALKNFIGDVRSERK